MGLCSNRLIVLVFVLCFGSISAQTHKSFIGPKAQAIAEYVYQYDFHRADSLINYYKRQGKPDNWIRLAECNYLWWLIVTGEESTVNVVKFKLLLNEIVNDLDKKGEKNFTNDDYYIYQNTYAFKCRIDLFKGKYLEASSHLNSCIHTMQKTFTKEGEYEAFKLTTGLYNYFIDHAKINYPIARPIIALYPPGKKYKGIEMLTQASKSSDYIINNEGTYFLCKIYQETEKEYVAAEKYAHLLITRYPRNVAYQFNYFDIILKQGRLEEAKKQLIVLNKYCLINNSLTDNQKKYFINHAQKLLQEYYKKHKDAR